MPGNNSHSEERRYSFKGKEPRRPKRAEGTLREGPVQKGREGRRRDSGEGRSARDIRRKEQSDRSQTVEALWLSILQYMLRLMTVAFHEQTRKICFSKAMKTYFSTKHVFHEKHKESDQHIMSSYSLWNTHNEHLCVLFTQQIDWAPTVRSYWDFSKMKQDIVLPLRTSRLVEEAEKQAIKGHKNLSPDVLLC